VCHIGKRFWPNIGRPDRKQSGESDLKHKATKVHIDVKSLALCALCEPCERQNKVLYKDHKNLYGSIYRAFPLVSTLSSDGNGWETHEFMSWLLAHRELPGRGVSSS